jgi:hypothetical protein
MADDQSQYKELAMQWKRATPYLAAARRRDIRLQNTARAIHSLDPLFQHANKTRPFRKTSGLVEMYRILMRSRG